LLAALAACGRIGYEGAVTVGGQDGPNVSGDAGTDGSERGADQQVPGLDFGMVEVPGGPAPDVAGEVTSDLVGPDIPDAAISPDGAPPRDSPAPMETPPPDAGVDGPAARTVVATGQTATPRRGGSGGTAVVELCPDGGLLVGYEGTQSANPNFPWIVSMVGICATVTLSPPGVPATAWQLTRLPARGGTSGERWSRMCPAGHVLVGFDGNAGSWIGQIVFACAPIALNASGQAAVLGSDIELDDVGGAADNDFPQTDCPDGQAARGAETRVGSYLEGFGLICGSLVLR
jgi:hypothetical protein